MEMMYKDVEGYIKVSDYLESLEILRLSCLHIQGDDIRDGIRVGIERSMMEAKNFPIEDVKPVKRGKWNWKFAENGWADHICSECGFTHNTDIHIKLSWKFCPMCGAEMVNANEVQG